MKLEQAASFFDEMCKLGAISEDQARQALDRLDTLERSKPTAGQMARYGAIGAAAGPVISAVGNVVKGKPAIDVVKGLRHGTLRSLAGESTKGAIAAGAVPLVRRHFDRKAEVGTLQNFMQERAAKGAGGQ